MHDVLIVGAGPAGSTAANLLAQAGVRAVTLDRDVFPRFHIGESLLPIDLPIFARLGVAMDRTRWQYKQGAEFIDERTGEYAFFSFADGLDGTPAHAWQVDRAAFDKMLADVAVSRGADIRFRERVTDIAIADDHVRVTSDRGEHRARFLLDCTGQDAMLGRGARTIAPLHELGRAAVFCHFDDLAPDVRQELGDQGNIKVLIVEDGWHWLIPMHGGRLSVGLVKWRGKLDDDAFEAALAASPLCRRLTAGARRSDTRTIRNWSYKNTRPSGPRWACVGDACAFLDPVFSSGVSLAMLGAERTVDALVPALAAGREGAADLMAPVHASMEVAYVSFEQLIRRFYHTRMVSHLFFARTPDPMLRKGLISMLAGDVWRDDNPFQDMLRGSRVQPQRVTTPNE
ncbi:NAD(P)/FAD-dependent oxidoreductase [Nannocystis bainbridge]|uniref:NAD(P)/FAD-dependent oxidoreductase n=1 Tax=Nannocystis bainbridge TaxID=2995303 RepID=A0ABT5EA45_9BACT|nr:NAD(P)/FAD-dependent oxidoreductase [Nannocystis bainbridge]MDC0722707.1 NAD(P)/FAD-dependent oxidoreductase [Nannocystis bainbridge]